MHGAYNNGLHRGYPRSQAFQACLAASAHSTVFKAIVYPHLLNLQNAPK